MKYWFVDPHRTQSDPYNNGDNICYYLFFIGIGAYMRTVHPDKNHQLDVWHVCKDFVKKLIAGATNEVRTLININNFHAFSYSEKGLI